MWPKDFLLNVPFDPKPDTFIQTILKPDWANRLKTKQSLLDLRNEIEEIVQNTYAMFSVKEPVYVNANVMKDLKIAPDRLQTSLKYLDSVAVEMFQNKDIKYPDAFIEHSLEQQLQDYYEMCKILVKYRPILFNSRETIELVLKQFDSLPDIKTSDLTRIQSELGLRSRMPVLALWHSNLKGDAEDLFLHCPLPRVFGAPSCIRNSIERCKNPLDLCKMVRKQNLNMDRVVLAGHGHIAYLDQKEIKIVKVPRAYLIANLPGLSGYIWILQPTTLQAAIYTIWPTFELVIEFDLTNDESEETNWIDCQRDTEGNLVLLYGHINALTGSLLTQNMAAFDEEILSGGTLDFLTDISEIPNRQTVGQRIDWRDHGNLISAHHSVKDAMQKEERVWHHTFDIVFANHLLFTIETEARPIEAVYGSPFEMFVLSPLSSKKLQHWTLNTDSDGPLYKMEASRDLPKLQGEKYWQTMCVA